MNIDLSPELERLVEKRVKSGQYSSASEVVRDALLLLSHRDDLQGPAKRELQNKIALGLDSLELGKGVDGDEFFDQLAHEEAILEAAQRQAHEDMREAV